MPHVFAGIGAMLPAGMTKDGASSMGDTTEWTVVPLWTADATNYPGSVVSGGGLQVQSSNGGAQLTCALVFAGGALAGNYQARLRVGTTVVATGAVVSGTSGTMTVSATVPVSAGDIVMVETQTSVQGSWRATVSGGTATYVRVS
ncbi:hypothetical protein [Nocardia fluminea]|uniref:hypothetical protein n=1 Tax=Nocardia fluminea TaxID=134984 RepID=UPI00343F0CCD